jgi:hypothetical protein
MQFFRYLYLFTIFQLSRPTPDARLGETRLVIINIIKKQRYHQYQYQLSLNV